MQELPFESYRHMDDSTWYSTYRAYWSGIEVNVGIVCACMPALNQLMKRAFPNTWNRMRQYERQGRNGIEAKLGDSDRESSGRKAKTHSHDMFTEDSLSGSNGS